MNSMPVFVKIEEYEDVIELLVSLRTKIENAKMTLGKINQLKQEEDAQLQSWKTALAEIESRLASMDQFLHEPEQF